VSDALVLEDVEVGYGPRAFALRVPHLRLRAGEAVALMGPSGSGKSTLLHAAAGVLPARAGDVTAAGTVVARAGRPTSEGARRRMRLASVGLVLQELELLEHLDVEHNILLAWHLGATPAPWSEARARARALATRLDVVAHLARRPRALSQGERQRVAVARALAPHPRLLLADEPTGNLDATSATRVVEALLAQTREQQAGLLLVTHDPDVARRMDRTLRIEDLRAGVA
jgi:putative ABC transport system ATP-binding protein